jgi:hypothetical protein
MRQHYREGNRATIDAFIPQVRDLQLVELGRMEPETFPCLVKVRAPSGSDF